MSFSFLLRRTGLTPPDYRIADGRIVLSTGADAVRDRLFTALSTQLGEWFLDAEDGVPYYGVGGILGGKMTEAEVGAILRRRILLDPEVSRVVTFTMNQNAARRVFVVAEVLLALADGTSETITVET